MGDLPVTQSQEDNLEPATQYQIRPWGRLCSFIPTMPSVDLYERTYTFGRAPSCSIFVESVHFKPILNVSKEHFRLYRDFDDIVYLLDLSKNGTFVNDIKIGKNNKYIVHNGDVIAIGHQNCKAYTFSCNLNEDCCYPEEVRKLYFISRKIGRGAFGEVTLAFDRKSFKKYAIKKINKGHSNSSLEGHVTPPQKVKTEIEILTSFSYTFIIEMKEVFETDREVFLVLEYMEGGELTSRIMSVSPFPEAEVKFIFYQILLAVRYLHLNGVTHRDLKPENVLLHSSNPYPLVKISDFGLSKIMDENSMMETVCGTINYAAPEVLKSFELYNKKVDIWSLGVILFYMLSKKLPFEAPDRQAIARKIIAGNIGWDSKSWTGISNSAKDLIRKMLIVNPQMRFSIVETFRHDWIDKDVYTKYKVESFLTSDDDTNSSG